MNPLNAYLAFEIMNDHAERAERHRRAHERARAAPVPPLRRGHDPAHHSGRLDRAGAARGAGGYVPAPSGAALVAEVDERILAARWIEEDVTLAAPVPADRGAGVAARCPRPAPRRPATAHDPPAAPGSQALHRGCAAARAAHS